MKLNRRKRGWLLIAAIAIGIALVCLLIPHSNAGSMDSLAIVPLLFVGLISPLSLLAPLTDEYTSRAPEAPALPALFQRPPPFALA